MPETTDTDTLFNALRTFPKHDFDALVYYKEWRALAVAQFYFLKIALSAEEFKQEHNTIAITGKQSARIQQLSTKWYKTLEISPASRLQIDRELEKLFEEKPADN